ncbi:MAG: DUF981 domain-containing protein [Deltaproteobacteria bacterium]|nr:DUF981 domain-containing protein [Deltaproteobacteria bacterium]
MGINFVTLMLLNMAAGLALFGLFIGRLDGRKPDNAFAPPFAVVGFIGLITGFRMIFSWPLIGSYNILFGETTVWFGALFLALAWVLTRQSDLLPLAIVGGFAGLAALVLGARVLDMGLTAAPPLAAMGFILTGLGALLAAPAAALGYPKPVMIAGRLVVFAASAVWLMFALMGYWMHLGEYAKYGLPTGS